MRSIVASADAVSDGFGLQEERLGPQEEGPGPQEEGLWTSGRGAWTSGRALRHLLESLLESLGLLEASWRCPRGPSMRVLKSSWRRFGSSGDPHRSPKVT